MVLMRVDSIWSGAGVTGGGITQMFFNQNTTDEQAIVDAVEDFWNRLLDQVSSQCSVRIADTVPSFDAVTGEVLGVNGVSSPGDQPGLSANHMLPRSTQALIRWQTAEVVNNRVVRGRTFVPGQLEDNNFSPGVPGGSIIADGNDAAAQLVADATANLVIWHRPVAGSGGQIAGVIAGAVWSEWAVLRSRRD